MDPCLLSRCLEIICEKERGAWWKHGRWRQARREGAPSALVCLPCTPCSFWRPLILSSACYTGYTDPKLHWPFWILWLGLCSDMPLLISVRQTLSSYGKESVSSLNSFIKHVFCVIDVAFHRFCLSSQWDSSTKFKVIEQGLHLSQNHHKDCKALPKNNVSVRLETFRKITDDCLIFESGDLACSHWFLHTVSRTVKHLCVFVILLHYFCVLCFSSDGEIYRAASSLVFSRKGFEKGSSSLKKKKP